MSRSSVSTYVRQPNRGIIPHLITKPVSHQQSVCRLYKLGLETMRSRWWKRIEIRYHQIKLREEFDAYKDIKDYRVARALLASGWERFHYEANWAPFIFPDSKDGPLFEKGDPQCDSWLDDWHPLEKKMYPDYFERREKRKQEFINRWNEKYGTPTQEQIDEEIWFQKSH